MVMEVTSIQWTKSLKTSTLSSAMKAMRVSDTRGTREALPCPSMRTTTMTSTRSIIIRYPTTRIIQSMVPKKRAGRSWGSSRWSNIKRKRTESTRRSSRNLADLWTMLSSTKVSRPRITWNHSSLIQIGSFSTRKASSWRNNTISARCLTISRIITWHCTAWEISTIWVISLTVARSFFQFAPRLST